MTKLLDLERRTMIRRGDNPGLILFGSVDYLGIMMQYCDKKFLYSRGRWKMINYEMSLVQITATMKELDDVLEDH